MQFIGYILLVLLGGGGSLVVYLRRWEAQERMLSAPSELITLKALLAPGISNAPQLFAQGHAKAVPQLSELGAQCSLVIEYTNETDTSATVTAHFRVESAKSAALQSAYASYFPDGELSFFDVNPKLDTFAQAHQGVVAGHQHNWSGRLRVWSLGQLQRLHLA